MLCWRHTEEPSKSMSVIPAHSNVLPSTQGHFSSLPPSARFYSQFLGKMHAHAFFSPCFHPLSPILVQNHKCYALLFLVMKNCDYSYCGGKRNLHSVRAEVMTFVCMQHLFRAGRGGSLHAHGEAALCHLWLRRGFLGWCYHGLGHGCQASQHPCMTPRRCDDLPVVGFDCSLSSVLLWSPRGHWAGRDHRILGIQTVRDHSRMRHEKSLLTVCPWERKYRDDFKCQQSMNTLI